MHRIAVASLTLLSAIMICANASAQTFAGNDKSEKMLEALSKKIDDQNAKIDTLSQQILKLEQQVSKVRPGVMIGETPSPSPTANATSEASKPAPTQQSGNSHVVAKGETLVIIGRSGGGKSVLLKHLIGLMQPDAGEIWIDGQNIIGLSERKLAAIRRKVGILFQGGALFDSMTVEELQKFNHIENDRKLQIGQTIMIPPAASSSGASPSPNG